jgi:hypothetical protein
MLTECRDTETGAIIRREIPKALAERDRIKRQVRFN